MQGRIVKVFADQSAMFVKADDGADVFSRRTEWTDPPATFIEGARVEFSTYRGPKGMCAEQTRLIDDDGKGLEYGEIEGVRSNFGFVRPDAGGPNVFLHFTQADFIPAVGDRCSYILTSDKSGRPRAVVCRRES